MFSHTPRGKLDTVARTLKAIHAQEDRQAAALNADSTAAKLTAMTLITAAALVTETVAQTLTHQVFPSPPWRQINTNHPLERIIRECAVVPAWSGPFRMARRR